MLFDRFSGGRTREVASPGEQELPARNKHSGSAKGDGFFGGRKPLKRRCKAEQVLQRSAGAERVLGNGDSITGEEESSEGRSPGAWEAERGFRGTSRAHTVERVAKP
jgi:hypothetical protein